MPASPRGDRHRCVISTPMGQQELASDNGDIMRAMIAGSGTDRIGTPSDIADAVAFLLGRQHPSFARTSEENRRGDVQKPAADIEDHDDPATTLPEAMTDRPSPAKAAIGHKPVFAYIASLPAILSWNFGAELPLVPSAPSDATQPQV